MWSGSNVKICTGGWFDPVIFDLFAVTFLVGPSLNVVSFLVTSAERYVFGSACLLDLHSCLLEILLFLVFDSVCLSAVCLCVCLSTKTEELPLF